MKISSIKIKLKLNKQNVKLTKREENNMDKFKRIFEKNLECTVSNSHLCNNPKDVEATIAINKKMKKIESEFRSKSI